MNRRWLNSIPKWAFRSTQRVAYLVFFLARCLCAIVHSISIPMVAVSVKSIESLNPWIPVIESIDCVRLKHPLIFKINYD